MSSCAAISNRTQIRKKKRQSKNRLKENEFDKQNFNAFSCGLPFESTLNVYSSKNADLKTSSVDVDYLLTAINARPLPDSEEDSGCDNSSPPPQIPNGDDCYDFDCLPVDRSSYMYSHISNVATQWRNLPSHSSAPQMLFALPVEFQSNTFVAIADPELFDIWNTCSIIVSEMMYTLCVNNEHSFRTFYNPEFCQIGDLSDFNNRDGSFYLVKNFVSHTSIYGQAEDASSQIRVSPPCDDDELLYEFLFPTNLCGRLIGRSGSNIDAVKRRSNTKIIVKTDSTNFGMQVVSIQGLRINIISALSLLEERFSQHQYPNVSFEPYSLTELRKQASPLIVPPYVTQPLRLDSRATSFVRVTTVISPNHFFAQSMTLSAQFYAYEKAINTVYKNADQVPSPSLPVIPGTICVMPLSQNRWVRVIVRSYCPDTKWVTVYLMDYGSHCTIHVSMLRLIRSDLAACPALAMEILIDGIENCNDNEEHINLATNCATQYLDNQIVELRILGTAVNGPQVAEAYLTDATGLTHMVKEDFIMMGVAKRSTSLKDYIFPSK